MYAVIESGGKQYRVSEGDTLKIEKLSAEVGQTIDFDKVLMVAGGEDVRVGKPFVDGGKVSGTVVEQGRGKKIWIFKMRRRKNSRRQMGHRQSFTEVKIDSIEPAIKVAQPKAETKAAAPKKATAKKATAKKESEE